ncbi:MAG TPA: [protein-PII] uridylyltransferase, partial [Candidatus Bathyarchaeia archaeon]|nr:[protein-PII] uridylyltransferase [Candidatus Bathyarchaeia archaeon]
MKPPVLKRSALPSPVYGAGEDWMTSFAGEVREAHKNFLKNLERCHRAGASGIEVARACSAAVEAVTVHLHDSLRGWMGPKLRRAPAVIALGGFGRRELSPRSDVDLLFLWDKKPGPAGTAFAGYLVRMLWDSGLELGHSVRTLPELRAALDRDTDLMTAILDSRLVCGDDSLKDELHAIKEEIRGRESGGLLSAKLDEARRRWEKYGWSYHLIEPNVKESPGGLRDHQMIRWVGMALPWEGTLEGLYRLAIIDRGEIKDVKRAFDFLLRTRHELHFLMGTNWNVLTLELQRSAAKGLAYQDAGELLAVERFMRDYYSMTRSIFTLLERFLEETRGEGNLRIIEGSLYRRVGTRGLGQIDMRMSRARMQVEPLAPFKEQLRTGKRLSPQMERRIRNLFRPARLGAGVAPRMRQSFIELLEMPGKKAPVIRSMHELGVLRHLFPPFDKLTCLKKYDLYHQYTADEHSLQAVANLDELLEHEGGLLPRLHDEIAERTELVLATLLHDIGKPSARGHAQSGARMADRLLREFPVSQASRVLITFLVRNHLLLSHFSQRRNMEDLDTGLQLVRHVKSHRNLKLLYLLTYADLKATGPTVWTGWKQNLLEDLYFKASRMLADKSDSGASYRRVLEKRHEKMVKLCESRDERAAMEVHLASLPERYAMVVTPARARSHVAMVARLHGRSVIVEIRRHAHSIELTICTRDRPYRLSQVCGVITINDLNILGAFAFTRKDGIVIDVFYCTGVEGRLALAGETAGKLERDLAGVFGGQIDLERAYGAHVERWKWRTAKGATIPTVVEFENELSRECTIIDLSARDRPGLLYRVTRILSEERLDIQSAQ